MTLVQPRVADAFAQAIVARDISRAVALLDPAIDFRAMTPSRVWEAEGPADVERTFRQWLEDPDEEVHDIEATETAEIVDTLRVGWRVRISDADGLHLFEQQAYVREHEGRITWMRVICSGFRPLP